MARPQAKDHQAKRDAILNAAAAVFAREGFDRASMSALAGEAGISKANIYHYYDSKSALLFDLLDTHLSGLRQRLEGLNLSGKAPADKLLDLTTELLLAYEGADNAHRIQSAGMSQLPEAERAVLVGHQRAMVQIFSDTICENAPAQLSDDPKALRAVTMSVFGMLNWFYMWNAGADAGARRAYAKTVTRLTIGGLGAVQEA